jgi:hypothetical protein
MAAFAKESRNAEALRATQSTGCRDATSLPASLR